MRAIDTATQLCAVIGHPVGHSLSPAIHNAAFEALGLNYVYLAFDVDDVGVMLAGMRAMPSFRGLSVTIPHKLAVIPHLDDVEPMARHVGSVNTITHDDGHLTGASTDGPGTLRAFAESGVEFSGKRVLFVGTGGAVRAVAFAVAELTGASGVTIVGRTQANVESLVRDVRAESKIPITGRSFIGGLEEPMATHDIIIQGTPIGMAPERVNESPIPAELLRPEHVVFDMVYRPLRTKLIRDADARGCTVVLGREMFIHQAALQFQFWTGLEAPIDVMRRAFDAAAG